METLIVTKEVNVCGHYEEPLYEHAPWITYTSDVRHCLYPGDICHFDEDKIYHQSTEYGASMYRGTLWLCPTQEEKATIFGLLTGDKVKPYNQLMEKKEKLQEKLEDARGELYSLLMEFDYQSDETAETFSLDITMSLLNQINHKERELMILGFRYFSVCMSIQLRVNTLKRWHCKEEGYVSEQQY